MFSAYYAYFAYISLDISHGLPRKWIAKGGASQGGGRGAWGAWKAWGLKAWSFQGAYGAICYPSAAICSSWGIYPSPPGTLRLGRNTIFQLKPCKNCSFGNVGKTRAQGHSKMSTTVD